MKTHIVLINKTLRKWTSYLEEILGVRLEPHLVVVIATVLILLVQLIMYLALSSQTIYCQLPNLRTFHRVEAMPSYQNLPTIYVVTPTYERFVQKAELIRLSNTLLLVPNLYWIIVEDSDWRTDMVSKFVRRLKNQFNFHTITHLTEPTPIKFKLKPNEPSWRQPKGVWQRNRALEWLRENIDDLDLNGVVYFADDDNTYDLELFNEMRYTRRVSVWPVGFVGGLLVERPLVRSDNRVESFNSMWESKRPFPIDMAGFAVSLRHLMSHPNVKFSATQRIGYVESHFLGQLVKTWDELEPKANKCTKILVWHTQTKNPVLHEEKKLSKPSHLELEW